MDEHLKLLEDLKFKKQLEKLNKKLKNKKIIIYGAGIFFKKIQSNYDLSNLNIIGISDKKFQIEDENKTELGYNIIPCDKIEEYKPDYILIATLNSLGILYGFKYNRFKNSKIKVLPIVDKPFTTLLKEILL